MKIVFEIHEAENLTGSDPEEILLKLHKAGMKIVTDNCLNRDLVFCGFTEINKESD